MTDPHRYLVKVGDIVETYHDGRATVTKAKHEGHVQYDFDSGELYYTLHTWESWVKAIDSGEVKVIRALNASG